MQLMHYYKVKEVTKKNWNYHLKQNYHIIQNWYIILGKNLFICKFSKTNFIFFFYKTKIYSGDTKFETRK